MRLLPNHRNTISTATVNRMMDSDDDDIYPQHEGNNGQRSHSEVNMHDADDGEEEGEEVEDDDSDVGSITTHVYYFKILKFCRMMSISS